MAVLRIMNRKCKIYCKLLWYSAFPDTQHKDKKNGEDRNRRIWNWNVQFS